MFATALCAAAFAAFAIGVIAAITVPFRTAVMITALFAVCAVSRIFKK